MQMASNRKIRNGPESYPLRSMRKHDRSHAIAYGLADAMGYPDYKRVAHAEGSVDVAHAGIRPSLREPLELIELVGNQPAVTPVPSEVDP